ncbi:MAG: hypothetical protein JWM33_419, partial [Caulobacteraceae bacterium]|nr:hypothetical protein [Caulobacteraceae bacterium]
RRSGVPGAVVVVTDGDRVLWRAGLGVDGRGQAFGPDSQVPICSVSKSFVALAVMQQVEAGSIDLDKPAALYLPELHLADPRGARITVRQLLAHRSGLSDRGFREKSVTPTPRTLAEAVAALHGAGLSSEPGARRSYTNPNYWVLARMVEAVSGQPFDAYMRSQVFQPLGMTASSTWNAVTDAPQVAPGYLRILGHPFPAREPDWFLGGACGVVTTASDLGRWLVMQSTGRSPLTGQPLVSAASLKAMHEGLGWNKVEESGQTSFTHNGIMFTYSAHQTLLPDVGDGVGIAVVANAGVGLGPLPADEIAALLVQAAEGKAPTQPAPTGLIIDLILAGLAIAAVLGALWRWRRPLRPRPGWRRGVRCALAAAGLLCAGFYPTVLRAVLGRDLDWRQSLYATPMLLVLIVTLALVAMVSLLRQCWRPLPK